QQQLWFTWTPPAPGSWTVALALVDGNVNSPAQPLASETIQVAAAAQPSVEQLISLDDEQPFGGTLLIIIMACLALSVFSLSVLILRGQTQHDS
ncbi:MAG TPA: hypothetical protein VER79_10825, partial [Candidatus Limnocylindrales bacterium]|nr:hypothetical protein [Candidatus Limnocylindrales bacterium]